jgi:hypothetical protein
LVDTAKLTDQEAVRAAINRLLERMPTNCGRPGVLNLSSILKFALLVGAIAMASLVRTAPASG